jgi:hypothetical protein
MADPAEAREYLDQALRAEGLELKAVSLAIGRNHAYLQQYIRTGKPRYLPEGVREALVRVVPNLDGDRLKPPPLELKLASAKKRGGQGGDQTQINAPRRRKIIDDPSTLELLDAWDDIRHPDQRALAIRILRSMADQATPVVA